MKISAVVLTKNEEKNIERCLKSLEFCDEIIVVDDYSEDKTLEIIKKLNFGIKIFKNELKNDFASQRNFGLNKASNEWVLFIDADEEVTRELVTEITRVILSEQSESKDPINAFYVKRRDFFWNQELKYGEVRRIRQAGLIRLIRKGSGKWMGSVHEIFHTAKNTGKIDSFLNHYPHPSLKEFIKDVNRYSGIRAEELFNQDKKTNLFEIIFFPFAKFIYNYFLNLGFLDGPAGFTYAFMMSFHSFLVRAKLYQLTNKK